MNNSILWLYFTLVSDAAIGRGDGVAGLVDAEIKHDVFGLPFLSGKTLKGLLVAQCAEIFDSLEKIRVSNLENWGETAQALFGNPENPHSEPGRLRIEDACLPPDLHARVEDEFRQIESLSNLEERDRLWALKRDAYLEAVTALRRNTAVHMRTGAPLRNTLRTTRIVLRRTPFIARLEIQSGLQPIEKALLAACICAFSRLGSRRNRGLGAIKAELYDTPLFDPKTNLPTAAQPITATWLEMFEKEIQR
jgi:hypothetical protein